MSTLDELSLSKTADVFYGQPLTEIDLNQEKLCLAIYGPNNYNPDFFQMFSLPRIIYLQMINIGASFTSVKTSTNISGMF